jgi:hypothetical protein
MGGGQPLVEGVAEDNVAFGVEVARDGHERLQWSN